jgi:4-amino-4-deoxy-L-arabinose transferase-like glycosyltransferase
MGTNTLSKEKDISHNRRFAPDDGAIWVVLAVLVGIGVRGYFLAQPMRYDESFTFLNFISRDFKYLFFYPLPNNHVLYSILAKVSILIWGSHPVSIRLTAFLAGIALIPLVYVLCRRLNNQQSGIFAPIAIAIFPYFIFYSTNARGYTLLVLFTLILALVGAKIAKQPSILQTALFSLIAAFGMLTIPTMLFPIAGIFSWVFLLLFINGHTQNVVLSKFAIPGVLITSALTALFYTPVILVSNGIEPIIANRFVKAQPWHEFSVQVYPHFKQTFIDFTRDIPEILVLITMVLVAIGMYSAVKQRNWHIILILPSLLATSAIIFIFKQKIPFERTWIYIIPFIILVADFGFTYLITIVSVRMKLLLKITVFCISCFISISIMTKNAIASYEEKGVFAEAKIVAMYLKPIMSTNDIIHIQVPADWPLYFYLWYYNVPQIKASDNSESRKEYFVVKKSSYSIKEMTKKPHFTLLNIGDMALYQAVSTSDQ